MSCTQCQKQDDLCVCSEIQVLSTDTHVLILQHPQEPDKRLGSARLAHLSLKNSTLKIGLSWPNLKKVLGREITPSKWAVLYLGSGIKGLEKKPLPLEFVSKKGTTEARPPDLEGLIILDGTWSQAKALWWRNAWLLKLKRVVLTPTRPSLYRELRREPRKECLSTIESIAEALTALGEPENVGEELRNLFAKLLNKHRLTQKKHSAPT